MTGIERYPLSDFDGCECGDYRRDHDGLHGAGRCRMKDDLTHGFEPCLAFKLHQPATELPEYFRKRKEALERLDSVFAHPGLRGLKGRPGAARSDTSAGGGDPDTATASDILGGRR